MYELPSKYATLTEFKCLLVFVKNIFPARGWSSQVIQTLLQLNWKMYVSRFTMYSKNGKEFIDRWGKFCNLDKWPFDWWIFLENVRNFSFRIFSLPARFEGWWMVCREGFQDIFRYLHSIAREIVDYDAAASMKHRESSKKGCTLGDETFFINILKRSKWNDC